MLEGAHTEPEKFKDIFERGIDPDVDDPTKVHVSTDVSLTEIGADESRIRKYPQHPKIGLPSLKSSNSEMMSANVFEACTTALRPVNSFFHVVSAVSSS